MRNRYSVLCVCAVVMGLAGSVLAAITPVNFTGAYSENFDEMGTGTAFPAGWGSTYVAGSHDLYTPADDTVNTGVLPSTAMGTGGALADGTATTATVAATPSGNTKSSSAYNWAVPSTFPGYYAGNRSLGTSPTGIAGMVLELDLTNNTGNPISALNLQYAINVFTTTTMNNSYTASPYANVEELPGYWVYYSLDGGTSYTYAHDDGHTTATLTNWPNSIRAVNENWSTALSSTWAAGSSIKIRFFDDNAQGPSPDELIGLDNLSVTPTPEPATMVLLALGGLGLIARRRSR